MNNCAKCCKIVAYMTVPQQQADRAGHVGSVYICFNLQPPKKFKCFYNINVISTDRVWPQINFPRNFSLLYLWERRITFRVVTGRPVIALGSRSYTCSNTLSKLSNKKHSRGKLGLVSTKSTLIYFSWPAARGDGIKAGQLPSPSEWPERQREKESMLH